MYNSVTWITNAKTVYVYMYIYVYVIWSVIDEWMNEWKIFLSERQMHEQYHKMCSCAALARDMLWMRQPNNIIRSNTRRKGNLARSNLMYIIERTLGSGSKGLAVTLSPPLRLKVQSLVPATLWCYNLMHHYIIYLIVVLATDTYRLVYPSAPILLMLAVLISHHPPYVSWACLQILIR